MDSPCKSLCLAAAMGVVGIVSILGITRMSKSFWSRRPPDQQQVMATGQQNRRVASATRRTLLLGEEQTSLEGTTLYSNGESIERLKANLDDIYLLILTKRHLESEVDHLREEKRRALSSADEAETVKIHELETKITIQIEEIRRLQTKLEKQDQHLQERSSKLFSLEYAAEHRDVEKEEKIARLESEVARLRRMLEENTTPLFDTEEVATNREQFTATNQRQREEIRQMKTALRMNTGNEQINTVLPPTIVDNAESLSVAEVADLVKMLNAQIEQGSSLITDSLFNKGSSSTGKGLEIVWDDLDDYIGSWLCNDLRRRSKKLMEPDLLITQITLQTGLVNACAHIINDWNPPFWIDDLIFSRAISSIEKTNGQATADAWGVLLRSHMPVLPSERQEASKRNLTEVLQKLVTAVGGPLENGSLPLQYSEVLEDIVKGSLKLHKIVSGNLVPKMELVTDTIPCDAKFDPSRMVDTEANQTGSGKVVCTVDMGLRCRKRDELRRKSEEWEVVIKPKVVLTTTLESYA